MSARSSACGCENGGIMPAFVAIEPAPPTMTCWIHAPLLFSNHATPYPCESSAVTQSPSPSTS